jgi:ubiquinone biosynthesis protein
MNEDTLLDGDLIDQIVQLLPEERTAALIDLMMQEEIDPAALEAELHRSLAGIDLAQHRDRIGALVNRIMPLETLAPDVYDAWRPIIHDAVAYVGSHLSARRLVPKLVEQMLLPLDIPLEQRLIILIAQMPSLQKIGQIVARNRNLEPAFRAELSRLENAIEDITPAEIRAEVQRQLGALLETYQVELQDVILAEASVSATLHFRWLNPVTRLRETGVFKVLKPYINEHFTEELELLGGLAEYFDANRHNYPLAQVDLREVFEDVRHLLKREVDFPNEQANLAAAYDRYKSVSGARVPRLIIELSTPTITAITAEAGVKVTEAFPNSLWGRLEVAARVIEALIAVPLFAREKEAFFHADPHAGNLLFDEDKRELIMLDWALTERLSTEQRRYLLVLVLAVVLRDEQHMFRAIAALSADDLASDQAKAEITRRRIAHFIGQQSPTATLGIADAIALVDDVVLSGIRFPAPLLIFRKALFTLDGVLHHIISKVWLDPVLAGYALKQGLDAAPLLALLGLTAGNFRIPLSLGDRLALPWSALFFGPRVWFQTAARLRAKGLPEAQRLLNQLAPKRAD